MSGQASFFSPVFSCAAINALNLESGRATWPRLAIQNILHPSIKPTSSLYVPVSVILPPSRTAIRSALAIVESLWATIRTVVFLDRRILSTALFTYTLLGSVAGGDRY